MEEAKIRKENRHGRLLACRGTRRLLLEGVYRLMIRLLRRPACLATAIRKVQGKVPESQLPVSVEGIGSQLRVSLKRRSKQTLSCLTEVLYILPGAQALCDLKDQGDRRDRKAWDTYLIAWGFNAGISRTRVQQKRNIRVGDIKEWQMKLANKLSATERLAGIARQIVT